MSAFRKKNAGDTLLLVARTCGISRTHKLKPPHSMLMCGTALRNYSRRADLMWESGISRLHFFTKAAQSLMLATGGGVASRSFASVASRPAAQGSSGDEWKSQLRAFEQRGIPERQDVLKQAESDVEERCPQGGAQRLSLSQLHAWADRAYGMFICFGMWTYFGRKCCRGNIPISTYAPNLMWINGSRLRGMPE